MPQVDEFGRAIPAGGGSADPDHYSGSGHHNDNHEPPPYHRESSNVSSHSHRDNYHHHRDNRRPRYSTESRGDRGDSNNPYQQSYGPSSTSLHTSRDSSYHEKDEGTGRDHRSYHYQRDRDRDYPRDRDREHSRAARRNSKERGVERRDSAEGGDASSSQQLPHPSLRYVQEPMLCEFLWKEQNQPKGEGAAMKEEGQDEEQQQEQEQNDVSGDSQPKKEENKDDDDDNNNTQTYDDYRQEYAWNVLKHFFNQHLDDSWFRQQFSPSLMVEAAQLERTRCHTEAKALKQELMTMMSKKNNNSIEAATKTMALEIAPAALESNNNAPLPVPSSHLFSTVTRTLHVRTVPPHVTDEHVRQALLPYLTEYVVQQQIQQQQQQQKSGSKKVARPDKKNTPSSAEVLEGTVFGFFSSTPHKTHQPPQTISGAHSRGSSSNSNRSLFLHRSVFCVCTSQEVLDGVMQLLQQRDHGAQNDKDNPDKDGKEDAQQHIPRKQDDKAASTNNSNHLDLEIDCTDPYGRTEYDANCRGGPPPDGLPVPPRKAVLPISRYSANGASGGVVKLSAALSSPSRFVGDQEAATTLARALDVREHVPVEDRLDSLLEQVHAVVSESTADTKVEEGGGESNNEATATNTSNSSSNSSLSLDISLAYLRRVHMYSFYKTAKAESFGDMLEGKSAAAQVQLREAGVGMPENEEAATLLKEDLLGQRLDDSIRQALEVDCHAWIAAADWWVNESVDTSAQEILEAEELATQKWISNHYMDDDGRARCSFHFCHKLFKDESFLSKHLLKKHHAYNQAERAKCHDQYMMSTWERAALRPSVPAILVDCGKQFGPQESHLSGGPEPRATDPEPALWERKQYQEKLLLERQELRSKRQPEHTAAMPPMSSSSAPHSRTPRNFVDVDDMKEETVEVSFDQVQLPPAKTAANKKKKKKRKLL